ncbi:diguanylate cyclase [Telmatobacter sp. DSM 110680]|uniref:Diguanylate cyclase n=1 Tax=Telmatobacter sp. DSM 110680 TaxID=3036704 RepID=A0AAU7DPA0_9BACT
MADRTELLESALDSLTEGVALADHDGNVVLWSRAAEIITGFAGGEVVGHSVRKVLNFLLADGAHPWVRHADEESARGRGSLVVAQHKVGHEIPLMARVLVLRDGLGGRIGTGVVFHPAESIDALPHGELDESSSIGESQAELEDRLATMHEDFLHSHIPLGVLWVTVDQARVFRRTHGVRACEAMLEKVERTLAAGLKPAEEIGRWGDDEFLVLSHERNTPMLAAHAQMLAGLSRTTEFRWWGDRASLTVSIGAAQAERGEPLANLLERAQAAMFASVRAGGNHITASQGRLACLPS